MCSNNALLQRLLDLMVLKSIVVAHQGFSLEADDSQNNEITTKLTYIFVCIDDASKKVEHRFKMPMI